MKNPKMDDPKYYVRCLTEAATIIGKRHFMPDTAPVEIPKSEYDTLKREYQHYEDKGTLAVDKPEEEGYVKAARQAKVAQKLAEETDLFNEPPPPSIEIPAIGMPAAARESAARSQMRKASINPEFCRAKRSDGLQCRGKPRKERDYCALHSKMVADGREVRDMNGKIVTLDDIE